MQTYANYAKPGVHQVQTYRGIKRGWANVGRPISKEEALQLCKWASTVSPNFNHRVRINPIELLTVGRSKGLLFLCPLFVPPNENQPAQIKSN